MERNTGAAMDFGQALHALKGGKNLYRPGWNGKGEFIYLVAAVDNDPAYLAIQSIHGITAPWIASQADMLADDWHVVTRKR